MEQSQYCPPRTIDPRRRKGHYFSSDTLRISKASPPVFLYICFLFLVLFLYCFSLHPIPSVLLRAKKKPFLLQFLRFCRKESSFNIFAPIPPFNFFSFCLRKKDFLLCHCVQSTVKLLTTNLTPLVWPPVLEKEEEEERREERKRI